MQGGLQGLNNSETPNANRVAGVRWLLSTYTIRLNHRHTGSWKSLNNKLYLRSKQKAKGGTK